MTREERIARLTVLFRDGSKRFSDVVALVDEIALEERKAGMIDAANMVEDMRPAGGPWRTLEAAAENLRRAALKVG